MSSFLCFVCHSTVNADTNEDTRDKYREIIGMNLCPDSHLCFICCHVLNKMWLFKSICLKRSLEYPVLFSEKGTINLQRSYTQVVILCPEDICLQHLDSEYHFYNVNENTPPYIEENNYMQLQEEMHFGLIPNNVEVQTEDLFEHFNDNLLRSDADYFNNEFLVSITKENNVTRKDMDEFIFGNDSVESPLENINKIELTNLDEMSKVNITLTDLNVRNFEKLQDERNELEKRYFRNDYVGKLQDCNDRNNSFVERDPEIRNTDYEKSQNYCLNTNYDDKAQDLTNNMFVQKSVIMTLQKPPELVRNVGFVEKPQEFVVRHSDFVESPISDNEFVDNDDENDINEHIVDPSYNEHHVEANNDDEINNDEINNDDEILSTASDVMSEQSSEEDTNTVIKRIKKPKKSKTDIYIKITLSLEEQKMDLEENRRDKKYTEAVFKCFSCAIGFLFKDSYQAHMMRHEESNGEHRCSVCTLRFANAAVLRSHRANHAIRYQCKQCDQIIKRRHRLSHACRGSTITEVTCHLCGSVFQGASNYQQHFKRVHQESTGRTYPCNICGKSFPNQAAVRTHMITHINKKFTCDVCRSSYSSPYTLSQHKKKHERAPAQVHYCVACNTGYSSRKSLMAHKRNALVHKERVYKCPVCDKTCPNLRSLNNHTTAVHVRSRDLFCAICPGRYSTRKGLLRHMKNHNNEGPTLLPLCHLCGQTFKSSSILKRHLKNVCEKDKLEEELSKYYEQ